VDERDDKAFKCSWISFNYSKDPRIVITACDVWIISSFIILSIPFQIYNYV
jgi:hypothetical protein